jgi:hypothetical protein
MNSIAQELQIDPTVFAGPVWVTLATLTVYYLFIVNIARVRTRLAREYAARGERFDRYFGQDRQILAADRIQLNMLEQMPVFLSLLWLHAFLVSAGEATILGTIWVISRALYPLVLGQRMGRDIPLRILWVTFTGYAMLVTLGIRIIGSL